MTDDPRRSLPGIDTLLAEPAAAPLIQRYGREPVKRSLRRALEAARAGTAPAGGGLSEWLDMAGADLEARARPSLIRVLNGTGVVLHTNLGRAPLAPEAIAAERAAAGYGNVELDLENGERGSRYVHCADLLTEITGAEAGLVVNNNAAAVSLVVNELAGGKEVVVSRGELVEIGGSFRIPDVVTRSGARLREVGTTNRTRPGDYAGACGPGTGLLLRVHPSNYRVEGFAGRPTLAALVEVARAAGVPLVHDVGSGLLRAELLPGFPHEPTVAGSLSAGVDLVTFSGDKLLGGPQAGLIAGSAELVARLRRNPLLRAFRVDKTTLAALGATLALYRDLERAAERVPALRMLRESARSVRSRAEAALAAAPDLRAGGVEVVPTAAVVGGGAFPGFEIASAGWRVGGGSPDLVAAACRAGHPPLVGRIERDAFIVDLRAIEAGEEGEAAAALAGGLARAGVEEGSGGE